MNLRLTVVSLLLVACGGQLDPPSLVDRPRLVGARVSSDRDPTLAMPSPGDTVTVDWFMVHPDLPTPVSAQLVSCAPLAGTSGIPACREGTIVPLPAWSPTVEPWKTVLTLPAREQLDASSEWLIVGAVCGYGGMPILSASLDALNCVGGSQEEKADRFALRISVAKEGETPNHNPAWADEVWTLDGELWNPSEESAGCGAPGVPSISASLGRDVTITFGWSEEDRETFREDLGAGEVEVREPLLFSHYANQGRLARAASAIDEATYDNPITLGWSLPEAERVPAEGMRVRFTTVVRDSRGGTDRADRTLCVTTP